MVGCESGPFVAVEDAIAVLLRAIAPPDELRVPLAEPLQFLVEGFCGHVNSMLPFEGRMKSGGDNVIKNGYSGILRAT